MPKMLLAVCAAAVVAGTFAPIDASQSGRSVSMHALMREQWMKLSPSVRGMRVLISAITVRASWAAVKVQPTSTPSEQKP